MQLHNRVSEVGEEEGGSQGRRPRARACTRGRADTCVQGVLRAAAYVPARPHTRAVVDPNTCVCERARTPLAGDCGAEPLEFELE
eukprot:444308-Pleurochrysis_carterae.AAC.1